MKLARAGYLADLRSGGWIWTYKDGTRARIDFQGCRHEIVLDYRVRSSGEEWQSVHQPVPIRWTPCRLGSERPWFVCDVSSNGVYCGRQVSKLYGAGRLFACRHCYRLGYAVQRGGPLDRAHHRLAQLHRRLRAEYDGPDGIPPSKPQWMRRKTYQRLTHEIEDGEHRLDRRLRMAEPPFRGLTHNSTCSLCNRRTGERFARTLGSVRPAISHQAW
jgi:hypothetical protein